ncbi:MAG: Maf family protein [Pseudomonadota bacterium]
MGSPLLLASTSETRARLLRAAGVLIDTMPARIDEESVRASLGAEGVSVRDMADALAEAKARRIGQSRPDRLVLGCDQTAEVDGDLLTKPDTPEAARAQLARLSGKRHALYSAAVLYEEGRPVWRFVDTVRLHARPLSEPFIAAYVERNWDSIRTSVGGYRLEEEGARLFTRVEGDYFTVLGLPLLPVLGYLGTRGIIDT